MPASLVRLSSASLWISGAALVLTMVWDGVPSVNAKLQHSTHVISISGMKFNPPTLTVHAGDTIVWKNDDIVPHKATSTDKAFNSKLISQGKSWKWMARRTGEFAYRCAFHPTMSGSVVISP